MGKKIWTQKTYYNQEFTFLIYLKALKQTLFKKGKNNI